MAPVVVPCTNAGAEILGIDMRCPSQDDILLIRQQLSQHGVVFFRSQEATPEDHIRFAKSFGDINVNRFFAKAEGHPEIAEVRKEPDQMVAIGEGFHTDHSYDREPALGSILVARVLPQQGGDTFFVDMRKAYETLPPELKLRIEGLNAVHSSRHVFGKALAGDLKGRLGNAQSATQTSVHPVVLTHPVSGRKVLFVNPTFTLHFEGMTREESAPLLETLYRHAVRAEHVHRFRWLPGSVAFWDNRSTWHCAVNDYHGSRRLMHRITLEGCKLSDLNDPDRLGDGHKVDVPDGYNPGDELHTSLRQLAADAAASHGPPPVSRL